VIILKFVEGLSNAETARILDKSEGAVKSLQHRVLASLWRILTNTLSEKYESKHKQQERNTPPAKGREFSFTGGRRVIQYEKGY